MSKFWADTFRTFMDLLIFQAGPQDLPTSLFLLKSTIVFYYGVGVLVALLDFPFPAALLISFLDTTLLIGMVNFALWIRNFTNRIPQTLSAIFGSLAILTFFSLPTVVWYTIFFPESENNFFLSLTIVIWLMWSLAVLSYILRNALEINQFIAAAFSIAYLISSFSLTLILFFP